MEGNVGNDKLFRRVRKMSEFCASRTFPLLPSVMALVDKSDILPFRTFFPDSILLNFFPLFAVSFLALLAIFSPNWSKVPEEFAMSFNSCLIRLIS